jgi:hypothetical protein
MGRRKSRCKSLVDPKSGIFAGSDDVIERITGEPPLDVMAFISKHRDAFERGDI